MVDHPYALAQNRKYRWYATIMISNIVPIFVILGCAWFLTMCRSALHPPENFFFAFSIVLLLTSSFKKIYISEGGWSSLRLCSKPKISLIRHFGDRSDFMYIVKLYLYLLFWVANGFYPKHANEGFKTTSFLCLYISCTNFSDLWEWAITWDIYIHTFSMLHIFSCVSYFQLCMWRSSHPTEILFLWIS